MYSESQTLCFHVSTSKGDEVQSSPDRLFWLPRDAAIDSAIALNHLRNCATTLDGLDFEVDGDKIHDCVADWISDLLYCVENFRFDALILNLEYVETADVVSFMMFTRFPLRANTEVDGLREVCLRIYDEALEALVEKRFLQWPYMQNLECIYVGVCLFAPDLPGDPTWIRGLFQLSNCKSISVAYCKQGDEAADCSAYIFVVLREVMEQFERATDVSGFPEDFAFVLRQPQLTWEHHEPTPTQANVAMPLGGHAGPWNVYATKNRATDMPLSVFVNTKENCKGDFPYQDEMERRFIFRKESYTTVCQKSLKRPLE